MKKTFPYLLFLATACLSSQNNSPGSPPSWTYTVRNIAPRDQGGAWKRAIQLHGEDREGKDVDRQSDGEDNWVYVGETDDKGQYEDDLVTERVRYRFANILITDWIAPATDVIIDQNTVLPAKISGARCVVPEMAKIYLANQSLELDCGIIEILGSVESYKDTKATAILANHAGADGLSAGKVILRADKIEVQGKLWIVGQDGADGTSFPQMTARYDYGFDGGHGGRGGDGGKIYIYSPDFEAYGDAIKFDAGSGGKGGKGSLVIDANGNLVRNHTAGADGADGTPGHLYRENTSD